MAQNGRIRVVIGNKVVDMPAEMGKRIVEGRDAELQYMNRFKKKGSTPVTRERAAMRRSVNYALAGR